MSLLLAACEKGDSRFSTSYPCSFIFELQYHPTSPLARVTDNPGYFVITSVERRTVQGNPITFVVCQPNNGDPKDECALISAVENYRSYDRVGANRSLIIGCTVMGELVAYDRQCPHCLANASGVNYPLNWTTPSIVECQRCHRQYNVNYATCTGGGDGSGNERLIEYRIGYNTQALTVHN